MKAKYLLLHVKGEQWSGNIRRIVKSNHDVWTADKLINEGYPSNPRSSAYLMIRIHKETGTDIELRTMVFDVKRIPADVIYWGNSKMPFMLVRLKDINKISDRL